eukprot:5930145-Pyramimonas_sp.AAC.1
MEPQPREMAATEEHAAEMELDIQEWTGLPNRRPRHPEENLRTSGSSLAAQPTKQRPLHRVPRPVLDRAGGKRAPTERAAGPLQQQLPHLPLR